MQRPTRSTSRSSHLRRTAGGSRAGSSAAIFSARISATATFGSSASMNLAALPGRAQANAAESGNPVHCDDDDKGNDEHGNSQDRNRAEVARLVEIEDQHRDYLGLGGEQHDGGGQFTHHADEDEAPS